MRDDERDVIAVGFANATPQPLTRLGTDRLKCCIYGVGDLVI